LNSPTGGRVNNIVASTSGTKVNGLTASRRCDRDGDPELWQLSTYSKGIKVAKYRKLRRASVVVLWLASVLSAWSQSFPRWRVGGGHPLSSLWEDAETVVVARLINLRVVGSSKLSERPANVDARVKRLYWCSGELQVLGVLKGRVPRSAYRREYLFAAIRPECDREQGREVNPGRRIEIWFLREEGGRWRPLYDAGSNRKMILVRRPGEVGELFSREDVGLRLLDELSWRDGIEALTNEMFVIGYIACDLLGVPKCIDELESLARRQVVLEEEICTFLCVTYRHKCRIR
jgi:hypothetical protein